MDVTPGMISQYENGKADISLSKMALISTYCGFSMTEYFDTSSSHELLDTFSKLVRIEGDRYKRHMQYREREVGMGKVLTGKVYQIGEEEVIEYIPVSQEEPFKEGASYSTRQKYLYGKMEFAYIKPFSEEEFLTYLNQEENESVCNLLESASDILYYIGDMKQKETLKSELADFVLLETIVNKASSDNEAAKRAYMYYKNLLERAISQ